MKRILNRQVLPISMGCGCCKKDTRVLYSLVDIDSGQRFYRCEDCVSKDDDIECEEEV